mmetsp:Transcript_25328/g.63512  ORF Transcript_25328/g.63512 Transcript_25328/m.63512 type:complete len:465 (-) Transcript_25328:1255-2649(-)
MSILCGQPRSEQHLKHRLSTDHCTLPLSVQSILNHHLRRYNRSCHQDKLQQIRLTRPVSTTLDLASESPSLSPSSSPCAVSRRTMSDPEDLEQGDQVADAVRAALDSLTERRGAVRINALKSLCSALSNRYRQDVVEENSFTFMDRLTRCVQKGTDEEQALACQCMGLMVITAGCGVDPSFIQSSCKLLSVLIKDKNNSPLVRTSAIQAAAVMCFVAASEEADSRELVELVVNYVTDRSDSVASAAVEAVSLLTTVLSAEYVCDSLIHDHLQDRILKAVENPNNQVAADAAELLCLLAEIMCDQAGDDEFDFYVLEAYVGDISNAVERIHEVAGTAQKRQAKKDRGETRTTAKLILRAMDEGESPDEVLTIRRQPIHFCGWKQLAQLDFLRSYLAQGLDIHLQENELLSEIFDFELSEVRKLSKKEKKSMFSKSSQAAKDRSQKRGKERKSKQKTDRFREQDSD